MSMAALVLVFILWTMLTQTVGVHWITDIVEQCRFEMKQLKN